MGGTGGIELRENSIRIVFSHQGKQQKETLYFDNAPLPPTPANAKYARRIATEIRAKIRAGIFVYAEYFPHSPRATVSNSDAPMLFDVMDRWIRLHNVKGSTKGQYKTRLENFWKVALKNVPIAEVRYSDILEALNSGTWKSGKSRNNELSMIKQVFAFAKKDKMIKANPCDEVERASYQKPGPDPFSLDETNLILKSIAKHYHEQIYNFTQFMFFTGMRTSEGISLRWGHVDFHRNEVLVELVNVYDEESDSTKTSVSRKVKLNSLALEALQRQKAHTFLAGDFIFHNPKTNDPWAYRRITDVRGHWEVTLKRVGLRQRRPYNMRHTYATIGLMSGARPAFLAKQLGHSLRMFFEVYADWINGSDDDREMDKIEESLSKIIPKLTQNKKAAQK